MTNGKPSTARPFLFLLAGLLCWFCAEGIANAQKVLTGSECWTETIDTNIPKGTTIRVRTTGPIDSSSSAGQSFQGVVDHDVHGDYGQVLIPKGAPVVLTAMSTASNEVTLVLVSFVTDEQLFGAQGSTLKGQCISPVTPRSSTTTARLQYSEVPANTLVTFRLNGPYVPVK